MKSSQKVALSLLVAVVVFSAFTVIAFSGLFGYIEATFYNPQIRANAYSRLDRAAASVSDYQDKNRLRFEKILEEPSIKNIYQVNQSRADIQNQQAIFGSLKSDMTGFMFVRFIDNQGQRLHFSTLDSDIVSSGPDQITYKPPGGITSPIPLASLALPQSTPFDLMLVPQADFYIYRFLVRDQYNITQGTALFYVSARGATNYLLSAGLIDAGTAAKIVSDNGVVVNLPERFGNSLAQSVSSIWRPSDTKATPLLKADQGGSYFIFSSRTKPAGYALLLVPEADFHMQPIMQWVLLAGTFLTAFLLVFLLLNIRQDAVLVLSDRIKRFQIHLLQEYLEEKEQIDWKRWQAQLEERRGEVTRRIKKGIGTVRGKKADEIDRLINQSWDEILTVLGTKQLEARPSSLDVSRLEDIIQRAVTNFQRMGVGAGPSRPAAAAERRALPLDAVESAGGGEPEEIEEADAVEELEEVEEAEVLEAAEAVDELEEAEADTVEELEEVEEAEVLEAAEAVDELEEAEADTVEELEEVEEAESVEELEEAEEAESVEEAEAVDELEDAEADAVDESEDLAFPDFAAAPTEDELRIPDEIIEAHTGAERTGVGEDIELDAEPVEESVPSERENKYAREEAEEPEELEELEELEEVEELEAVTVLGETPHTDSWITEEAEILDELEAEEDAEVYPSEAVPITPSGLFMASKLSFGGRYEALRGPGAELPELDSVDSDDAEEVLILPEVESTAAVPPGMEGDAAIRAGAAAVAGKGGNRPFDGILDGLAPDDYEVIPIARMLSLVAGTREVIAERDGVPEIQEATYGEARAKTEIVSDGAKREFSGLAESVLRSGPGVREPTESGIDEILSIHAIDLFPAEYADRRGEADASASSGEDDRKRIRFGLDGLDYDWFMRRHRSTESGIIKSLVEVTRLFRARAGSLFLETEKGLRATYSLGLDEACMNRVIAKRETALFREVFQKRHALFLRVPLNELSNFRSVCEETQFAHLQKSVFLPVRFNKKPAYLLISVHGKVGSFDALFLGALENAHPEIAGV